MVVVADVEKEALNFINKTCSQATQRVKFVFDGYDLKRYSIIKQQLLTSGKSNRKLPKIGREAVRAQSAGCLSREAGFDQASQTDEQTGSAKNSPERKPETRMSFKESQGGLPRYEDPGKKRFMKAV